MGEGSTTKIEVLFIYRCRFCREDLRRVSVKGGGVSYLVRGTKVGIREVN